MIDIQVGTVLGRLTVVKRVSNQPLSGNIRYECLCSCGNAAVVTGSALRRGTTKSCGCYRHDGLVLSKTTHGMSSTKEYLIWQKIKDRCYNENDHAYEYYGGRGITMCQEWHDSFLSFITDMGRRPPDKKSIDRIENNKGYNKENCRWATCFDQARNTRKTKTYSYKGVDYVSIPNLAEAFGLNKHTLNTRLRDGWSVTRAIETPIRILGQ